MGGCLDNLWHYTNGEYRYLLCHFSEFEIHIHFPSYCSLYSLDTGGRYAGDEASTWFSKYLNEPGVKLYKIDGPRFITDNRTWGDKGKPGEKVDMNIQHALIVSSPCFPWGKLAIWGNFKGPYTTQSLSCCPALWAVILQCNRWPTSCECIAAFARLCLQIEVKWINFQCCG